MGRGGSLGGLDPCDALEKRGSMEGRPQPLVSCRTRAETVEVGTIGLGGVC